MAYETFDFRAFNVLLGDKSWLTHHDWILSAVTDAKAAGANTVIFDYTVNVSLAGEFRAITDAAGGHPDLTELASAIAAAKAQGLAVYLKPHISAWDAATNLNADTAGIGTLDTANFFANYTTYTNSHSLVPMCPVPQSDCHDAPWLIGKFVPGLAAVVDNVVVGLEDAV